MSEYYSIKKKGFEITTNPRKIDLTKLYNYLAFESYWAQNIPFELVRKSIENSLNFSVIELQYDAFIGFARLITDKATFAYLADVFIDTKYRGLGLGKWLIETIMNHPEVQGLRTWFLFTKDAHGLYRQYGWKDLENPERAMSIRHPASELYKP